MVYFLLKNNNNQEYNYCASFILILCHAVCASCCRRNRTISRPVVKSTFQGVNLDLETPGDWLQMVKQAPVKVLPTDNMALIVWMVSTDNMAFTHMH